MTVNRVLKTCRQPSCVTKGRTSADEEALDRQLEICRHYRARTTSERWQLGLRPATLAAPCASRPWTKVLNSAGVPLLITPTAVTQLRRCCRRCRPVSCRHSKRIGNECTSLITPSTWRTAGDAQSASRTTAKIKGPGYGESRCLFLLSIATPGAWRRGRRPLE